MQHEALTVPPKEEALTACRDETIRFGQATVTIVERDGQLVVEVADDGAGGADPAKGTGLRGLADRVEAAGGRLTVRTEDERGTTVRAAIPCA